VAVQSKRRPGRPRSPEVDEAILRAAELLLRERGFGGMSIEGVAAEAGVSKTAIYRRFRDKADLAAAAVANVRQPDEIPDSGDTRADLLQLVKRTAAAIETLGISTVYTLVAEEHRRPELLERLRERAVLPGRAGGRRVLERARERGELRPDADIELALDMLIAPIYVRRVSGLPLPRGWERAAAGAVWRSVSG
jgi:AcrR family transcriptional regulator